MKAYFKKIYDTRYFWMHLALCDLKSRFRRSKLGLLWVALQPFILTVIMASVFSTVFHQPLGEYILYILSGMIVWNLLIASIVSSGGCLLGSEQYIRQFNHPKTIYSLRFAVLNTITFLIEIIALVIWTIIYTPSNLVCAFLSLPLTTVIYFILSWALSTVAGYMNAKYRDYPQVMTLVMQMLWYLSPVLFKEDMFTSNVWLNRLFNNNPITHILNLIRLPFLSGCMPQLKSYIYTAGAFAVFFAMAYWINKKNEDTIIFYL